MAASRKPAAFPAPHPRSSPDLIGHDAAWARVSRWIERDQLPQALLICGPRGIGKATLAYRVARVLLGGARGGGLAGTGSADGGAQETQESRWIVSATHPDLLSIERAFDETRGRIRAEIIVDDVRRIATFLSSSPAMGGWRLVIVDSADEMNRNAANALLKTLEEPSDKCLILLIAHRPALVSATIRSRCRRLLLQPLSNDVLQLLAGQFLPEMAREDIAGLCALADGSIGRVLQFARHGGLASERALRGFFTDVSNLPGIPGATANTLLAFAADPPLPVDDEGFGVAMEVLFWWLRRIAEAASRDESGRERGGGDDRVGDTALLRALCARAPLDRWLQVWDKSQQLAQSAAAGNLDRAQVLTLILLTLQRELRILSAG
ncbi:MAG: DNA polymerase III subunit delta' [Rhodospirillales bacterium]|nr:DNA polymerase III subunit delta' [Rhodospirillales bacterium]